MDIAKILVGLILLLVVAGGLLYLFYSRANAVEKTGYGTLIMLAVVSLPLFDPLSLVFLTAARLNPSSLTQKKRGGPYQRVVKRARPKCQRFRNSTEKMRLNE